MFNSFREKVSTNIAQRNKSNGSIFIKANVISIIF
jgi:hypothetical protein